MNNVATRICSFQREYAIDAEILGDQVHILESKNCKWEGRYKVCLRGLGGSGASRG
jgi:hypothetical protein